jgi:flagellar export protein FliJ
MKAFKFPLQRVLEWRGLQLRAEEEKLAGLQQQLTTLRRQEQELATARNTSQARMLAAPSIAGSDLQALAAFQAHVRKQQELVQTMLGKCEILIADQRQRLLKARTNHRILEKLKERRHRTWVYLNDQEVEETAAEAYLSKYIREGAERKSEGQA